MGLKEDLQHNQRIMRDMGIGGDSGQPEFYQYQWNLQERNPKYDPRGTSEQPIFKYTLRDQSPNSVIKDVIDETGKKVGAYNTQTGFKYGLTNPDLVKTQNDIVDSQSPDLNVNQTVDSAMNNSLLTSPITPTASPTLAQDNDPKRGRYISPATVNALNDMNPDAPDLSFAEQFVDGYKNLWDKIQNKRYQPDPYISPKPAYISQKDISKMNQQQSEAYPTWLTSNNPLNFNK